MGQTSKPPGEYRRADFRVGGETGAYVTVYQRPGEAPLLDLNFFDGDRSMGEALLRAQALTRAHELASHWHVQTRDTMSFVIANQTVKMGRLPEGVERVKTARVSASVPVDVIEQVDAARGGIPRAEVIRDALELWLAAQGRTK